MRDLKLILLIVFIIPLLSFTAVAQGFPWNDFKARTLKEIVKMDEREINESEKGPRLIAHANMLLSVVRVKYEGKSRPISSTKKDFLKDYWAKMFAQSSDAYSALYETDFLFTEDGTEYWLPVQKKVASYFPKELKVGDDIDIYLVRAGGVCKKKQCDWLFLVEEFRKPTAKTSN